MKRNLLIVGGVLLIIVVAVLALQEQELTPKEEALKQLQQYDIPGIKQRIVREDLRLSFNYYSGSDGYTLIESAPGQLDDPNLIQAYILMRTARYIEMQHSETMERPPAISVLVFSEEEEMERVPESATDTPELSRVDELTQWAREHSEFTGYNRRLGEVEEREIDGLTAISFRSDGLYASDVFVTKRGSNYYFFSGQFIEEGGDIDVAFDALMDSVTFD